jgi:Zn-dependent membrane protease YugP
MHIVIIFLLALVLFFGPYWWVRTVMRRYQQPRDDFPGTGGEFARHLLDRIGLKEVRVDVTKSGDHYDPRDRTVRLSPDNFGGRSLTAVVIAAHEVGHALQDAQGYPPLRWRHRLLRVADAAQQLGNLLIIGIPIITLVTRTPISGLLFLAAGLASFGSAALVHLITLPVELDASFRRALPLLEVGHYIPNEDLSAARQILQAAAFTYVAGALAGILNLWRWISLLGRRI